MSASSARQLARQWVDRLSPYRRHRNDEHLEALVEEAARYVGLHLEDDLAQSPYWAKSSLARRVAVLLFLVDRGVVERAIRKSSRVYEPVEGAEQWAEKQQALAPYLEPTLALIAALRRDQQRRSPSPLS